jgi:hypothetical protein
MKKTGTPQSDLLKDRRYKVNEREEYVHGRNDPERTGTTVSQT